MATILFWLTVLASIGTLAMPLYYKTKGAALWGWFSQLLGGAGFTALRTYFYPEWQRPEWSQSLIWVLVLWALLITGFIVAVLKPRKQRVHVA